MQTTSLYRAGSRSCAGRIIWGERHHIDVLFRSLKADLDIPGTNPPQESTVVSTVLTLSAGESRRITEQLELTLTSDSDKGAEVNNIIVCLDPGAQEVARSSSGTNHPAGPLVLTETLLLTATTAGTYRCELRAYFNGPAAHHMTAIRGNSFADTGTWLQVSAANEAGSHEWRPPSATLTAPTTPLHLPVPWPRRRPSSYDRV
jgi:hypothetical protein